MLAHAPAVVKGKNIDTTETAHPFFFDFIGTLPSDIIKQDLDKRPWITLTATFASLCKSSIWVHGCIGFPGSFYNIPNIFFLDFYIIAGSVPVQVTADVVIKLVAKDNIMGFNKPID